MLLGLEQEKIYNIISYCILVAVDQIPPCPTLNLHVSQKHFDSKDSDAVVSTNRQVLRLTSLLCGFACGGRPLLSDTLMM